jgi:iron complex transport system substrate-binding protein
MKLQLQKTLLAILVLLPLVKALAAERIVSVNGTISEIICALGKEKELVGVDVTSNYPSSLEKLPKVGHNRNISAEGVLSLNPTLVLGTEGSIKPEVLSQIKSAGIKVVLFKQDYSADGTRNLISDLAKSLDMEDKMAPILKKLDQDLKAAKPLSKPLKVLFIYARGVGSLSVSGTGTSIEKIIQMAGAKNAITGFSDFKPLTAESLAAANPDVILLFESGLESVGGVDGFLKVPGVAQTQAGKNRKIIQMDGQLLTSFGPRLGIALQELISKLRGNGKA